jgi:hypothetical protein
MKIRNISLFYAVGIIAILALSTLGQENVFSDPNVDYSFSIPDAKWKMTAKPSATNPNVEYVYNDRTEVLLEVRKIPVAKDAILSDVIRDEEQKLQFRPGFVAGKEENFAGRVRGTVFNFEYVAAARNMTGRFYFFRVNPTTVYLLRFTGRKEILLSVRNHTDSIARTFAVKP